MNRDRWGRVTRAQATTMVAVGYGLSRLAYHWAGVRFRSGHAVAYHQFIDAPTLRDHLWQSLWYDHLQPPGLNLIWGLALRLSPADPDRFLGPLFALIGLATAIVFHRLLVRLGCSQLVGAVGALAWSISPTAVFTDTYLLYTPIEIFGILAIALLVARWADGGGLADVIGICAIATVLALTRATFHLVWILALVALLVVVRRDWWRTTVAVALLPLVVVGGWYAKNLVLFDQFGPSSWMGMNLSRVTVAQLQPGERARLVAGGDLSPYAAYPSFTGIDEMDTAPPKRTGPGQGVPVLDEARRMGGRFPNLHHRDYLTVNEAALDDSLWVIRNRPGTYLRGIQRALSLTFTAPTAWFGHVANAEAAPAATELEWRLLGASEPAPAFDDPDLGRWRAGEHQWLVLVAYLATALGVPTVLARRRAWRGPTPAEAAMAFTWATVTYLTVLTTMAEFGENNRFRSVTDPAVWAMTIWLVVEALRSVRTRRRLRAGPSEPATASDGGAAGTPAVPPAGS